MAVSPSSEQSSVDANDARSLISEGMQSQREEQPSTAEPTPRTSGLALSLNQQPGPPAARASVNFPFERHSLLSLPRIYGATLDCQSSHVFPRLNALLLKENL